MSDPNQVAIELSNNEDNEGTLSKKWVKFDQDGGQELSKAKSLEAVLPEDTPLSSPSSSISVVATIEPVHTEVPDPLKSMPSPPRSPDVRLATRSSSVPPTWVNVDLDTIEVVSDKPAASPLSRNGQAKSPSPVKTSPSNGGEASVQIEPKTEWRTALVRASATAEGQHKNGDIIVTMLPINKCCSWVTPASFKPELIPEELMAPTLTLTVEDYVTAIRQLVNDFRFTLYMVMYKRVLVTWIALGFVLLLTLLFSGVRGLPLFGGGLIWLMMNAMGIFVCMFFKFKLCRMLEKCMATINEHFYKSKIILGIDDRGHISCHKVNLVYIYFDTTDCIKYLNELAVVSEAADATGSQVPRTAFELGHLDIDNEDIVIASSDGTRKVTPQGHIGQKLLLRYSQRWAKEFIRKRIELSMPLHPDGTGTLPPSALPPRHCATARCPCQYIEEHLRYKPLTKCSLRDLIV
ncbi:hypothetical protein HDE_09437 [Halotydeus destructor]|nr:hypothetical protein HDE_09437 [Halotydeus destructor]